MNTKIEIKSEQNELIGYLIITKDLTNHNNPFVRFVFIYPEYRGNKYSKKLYQQANQFCLDYYNQNLRSDKFNFIKKSALNIWNELISDGLARKIDDFFELI
jgi:predicted GNAT family N-acyltransferase